MTKNEKGNFQYEIFINSGVMHFIHEFKQRKEKKMSKKTNQPNMICPCCGGREFITTVTVTQDWRVSFGGDFLEAQAAMTFSANLTLTISGAVFAAEGKPFP